jgi:hypothetical protein
MVAIAHARWGSEAMLIDARIRLVGTSMRLNDC